MLVDAGEKIDITKNIFIRGKIRVLLEPDKNNNHYNSYYTDQSRPIGNNLQWVWNSNFNPDGKFKFVNLFILYNVWLFIGIYG